MNFKLLIYCLIIDRVADYIFVNAGNIKFCEVLLLKGYTYTRYSVTVIGDATQKGMTLHKKINGKYKIRLLHTKLCKKKFILNT